MFKRNKTANYLNGSELIIKAMNKRRRLAIAALTNINCGEKSYIRVVK